MAVIEIAPGADAPTLDDLRRWVRETMPAFAAPKAIEVVDALPRTALGKVRRAALR